MNQTKKLFFLKKIGTRMYMYLMKDINYYIQSSVSHDASEIFGICWFGAQKKCLSIIL